MTFKISIRMLPFLMEYVGSTKVFAAGLARISRGVLAATKTTHPLIAHLGPLDKVPNNFFMAKILVSTPINVSVLESPLSSYHNRALVDFIVSGFKHVFRLGYNSGCLTSSHKNKNREHTVGPFPYPLLHNFHCSPLGDGPKKDGTIRVVLDSSPLKGCSVNDGISEDECSVLYSSLCDAVSMVLCLGQHCFLAKLDIKHVF